MTALLNIWQRWTFAPTARYCHTLRHGFTMYIRGELNNKHYNIKTTIGWYYDRKKTA